MCKFAGCTTNAYKGSYCAKHGGGKRKCSVAGCTTGSERKGLCAKHGGCRDECVFGSCTNQQMGGMWHTCVTHGGKGYCTYILAGKCLTPAIKWGGNCRKHTPK